MPTAEKTNDSQKCGLSYFLSFVHFCSHFSENAKAPATPVFLVSNTQKVLIFQWVQGIVTTVYCFDVTPKWNSFEIAIDEKALKDEATRKQLYSILDYFKPSSQNTPATCDADLSVKFQLFPENYNLEHLIVNQSHNILWRSAAYDEAHPDPNFEHRFTINDFRMCPAWVGPNNCWANFIWIDKDFNRDSLKNKDIINKIIILRGTYVASEAPHNGTYAKKHSHIEIICQHIMKTNGYGELLTAYNNNEPRADVLRRYQTFINNYFSEDSLKELQDTLTNEFVQKLQELYQMI